MWSQMCQIIWKIPKIPVHVSNYTEDNEDMCPCVKLYRSYLRWSCVKFEIIVYYLLPNIGPTSTHSVSF